MHEIDRKDVEPKFRKQGVDPKACREGRPKHTVYRKDVDPKFRKQGVDPKAGGGTQT
jgi:hypothetical protein